jgi:hypothetical protein
MLSCRNREVKAEVEIELNKADNYIFSEGVHSNIPQLKRAKLWLVWIQGKFLLNKGLDKFKIKRNEGIHLKRPFRLKELGRNRPGRNDNLVLNKTSLKLNSMMLGK